MSSEWTRIVVNQDIYRNGSEKKQQVAYIGESGGKLNKTMEFD